MTNKHLTFMVIILISMVIFMAIVWVNVLDKNVAQARAISAVDAYISATADTGQMDDFLESPEGKTFVKYVYGN